MHGSAIPFFPDFRVVVSCAANCRHRKTKNLFFFSYICYTSYTGYRMPPPQNSASFCITPDISSIDKLKNCLFYATSSAFPTPPAEKGVAGVANVAEKNKFPEKWQSRHRRLHQSCFILHQSQRPGLDIIRLSGG